MHFHRILDSIQHSIANHFAGDSFQGLERSGVGAGFYLGSNGSGNYFPGQIGPLLLYDRELSSTEVTQIYDAYKSRFGY